MDISIVIVNYRNKALTMNSINSIREADFANLSSEIIVVDNDSRDGIREDLASQSDIKFVGNGKNIGMGAGNNVGIRMAQGKYIVVMNPDTVAFTDTFRKLYGYMEANPDVGMAGPKQYYPDMTEQDSCYRWHSALTPLYRRTPLGNLYSAKKDVDNFLMKDFDRNSIRQVDWLLGSFLFCRREALEQAGHFDERFFLYFEDTDLAKRFWKRGWKVVYHPEAGIIHNHARQSAKMPWYKFYYSSAGRHHFASWIKYLSKWGI